MSDLHKDIVELRNYVHQLDNVPWACGEKENHLPSHILESKLNAGTLEQGVVCLALAKLFGRKLRQAGIPFRYSKRVGCTEIDGQRHESPHAVVLVGPPGLEQLHDPYFNCSFKHGGQFLDLAQVKAVLSSGNEPQVCFDGCNTQWYFAWYVWQANLKWIAEKILAADDYDFRVGEEAFWRYLWPWLERGRPSGEYSWARSGWSYWEYYRT